MKIPIQNLYYLLTYAWDKLEEADKTEISIDDYKDSLNLLARILVSGSNYILKKGLDRAYIPVVEEYRGIKGKLQFKESLEQQLFSKGKSICSFDEFSENVLHNKILKSVLRLLYRLPQIDQKLRGHIWDSYSRFHGVDELDVQVSHFRQLQIHRNNYHYDFLMRVCKLVVENSVIDEGTGGIIFKDFLRNESAMAKLFEDFVRNFYAREQKKYKVSRENIAWYVEGESNGPLSFLPRMQTDITLEADDHKLIIDTKYYQQTLSVHFNTEKYHSTNLYQIYSYLTNLEKDTRNPNNLTCDGMLLYPTTQSHLDATYTLGKHKLRIATVDLNQNWNIIHNRLLELIA
jgi:5-methylcytosine-specific restriction enzyme subunit McrC